MNDYLSTTPHPALSLTGGALGSETGQQLGRSIAQSICPAGKFLAGSSLSYERKTDFPNAGYFRSPVEIRHMMGPNEGSSGSKASYY